MSRIRIRHIHSALLFSVPRALKKALALALKMFGRKERLVGAELRHAQDLLSRRMFDKYGKLKAAFMARDYNGDGTIGYNDFRQMLRDCPSPAERLSMLMSKIDEFQPQN